MTLTIEALRGVWRAQVDSRTEFAETLEGLLLKIAPGAPEEYVWHAAEVLGGVLGAEVVELSQIKDEDFSGLFAAVFAENDEFVVPLNADEDEPWQPTEAQSAYFEPERTDEVNAAYAEFLEDDGA